MPSLMMRVPERSSMPSLVPEMMPPLTVTVPALGRYMACSPPRMVPPLMVRVYPLFLTFPLEAMATPSPSLAPQAQSIVAPVLMVVKEVGVSVPRP